MGIGWRQKQLEIADVKSKQTPEKEEKMVDGLGGWPHYLRRGMGNLEVHSCTI